MTKRLLAILVLAVLVSCASSRDMNAVSTAQIACTSCHGDATRVGDPLFQAAPPASPSGGNGGTHLVHLEAGVACGSCHVVPTSSSHSNGVVEVTFSGLAVAKGAAPTFSGGPNGTCSNVYCHGTTLGAGGSVSTPAWSGGPLGCGACHGAPPPSHAPGSTNCNSCHPNTVRPDGTIDVAGGLHANGNVDVVGGHAAGWGDATQHGPAAMTGLASCRSCHGANLDGVGGTGPSCASCHYPNWQSNCTFCHGTQLTTYTNTPANLLKAAPPQGTQGETLSSTRAVGAHQKHLSGGSIGPAVACTECHLVPTNLSHLDGSATVTFGTLAKTQSSQPSWNGTSCASTWCHGGKLVGGSNTAPTWTGGSSQTTCGSCHGIPPSSHAAGSTTCSTCHGAGYSTTTVNASLHMNGIIDATQQHPAGWADKTQHGYAANTQGLAACTSCHGTDFNGGTVGISCNACHTTNGWAAWQTNCTFCHGTRVASYTSANLSSSAPPVGTAGETATSARAVGAHQKHLTGGSIGPAVTCATCHAVPTDLAHVNGVAVVTFGAAAKIGGATPGWNGTTCGSTYCHGGTLTGGSNSAPTWTAGSSQTTCGTCHGIPPSAPHTTSTACGSCHTGYTSTSVNAATHLNGALDVINLTCTSCHGQSGQTATAAAPLAAAPPVDTQGATTGIRVGAHQRHLVAGTYSNPMACQVCHAQVGTYTTSHANGTADVGFTGGANANLRKGTWTARSGTTAGSCSATWCHGAVIGETGGTAGGSLTAPRWSDSITGCSACHGAPPPSPHPTSTACGSCHSGYTATTVNLATHLNGVVDVANLTCTSCHGQSGQTATAASPLAAAPPVDTQGASSGLRVGAHQKHLSGGTYSSGFACQTCHAQVGTYTTSHASGTTDVGFTGAANANLQKGSWTARSGTTAGSCSATWCHGAVINRSGGTSGGTATVPSWDGSVTTCTVCHSVTMSTLPNNHTRSNHNVGCQVCHGTGYSTTTVNKPTHVDGVKTIVTVSSGTGIRTWNAGTRSCQPSCHGTQTW